MVSRMDQSLVLMELTVQLSGTVGQQRTVSGKPCQGDAWAQEQWEGQTVQGRSLEEGRDVSSWCPTTLNKRNTGSHNLEAEV